MGSRESASLEESDGQVERTILANHRKELALITRLLEAYLSGFNRIGSFALSSENELEYAWLLLVTRSFNSMRCAQLCLEKGYYTQVAVLARSAYEDWLVCKDCQCNRQTLDAVLKGKGELGKGKLTFSEMAKRISPDFHNQVWLVNYGQLSEIAHPRKQSLRILVDPDTHDLGLGGIYDQALFDGTCDAFVFVADNMLEFLARFLDALGLGWRKEEIWPIIEAARAYRKQMKTKVCQEGED